MLAVSAPGHYTLKKMLSQYMLHLCTGYHVNRSRFFPSKLLDMDYDIEYPKQSDIKPGKSRHLEPILRNKMCLSLRQNSKLFQLTLEILSNSL